jgi:squalene cyclase
MTGGSVSEDLCATLATRQLPNGGWPALSSSSQASLEASTLAHVALVPDSGHIGDRATDFLLKVQNPNGSWPAFLGDDHVGSWTTSLALIALRSVAETLGQRVHGGEWLIHSAGKESNWFWNWKFRTTDRHVCFDPGKFGWPWIPDTNSWVVPTAFAIRALTQPGAESSEASQRRVELGIRMLLDRCCPGGGWNAGNGIVYGRPMAPHPDDTAIALLALSSYPREPVVTASLDWLASVVPNLTAPWSLAWSILALATHQRSINPLLRKLSNWPGLKEVEDNSTLAVSCLALDPPRTLARFGIAPW